VGRRDAFGRPESPLPRGDPSGTYGAWFYLPSRQRRDCREWTNVFQFKEEGSLGGEWHQDASWWLNVSCASAWGEPSDRGVIFVNHWTKSWGTPPKYRDVPLDRWFEVRAVLEEGVAIHWYVDGEFLDISRHETHPVGRMLDATSRWIFGVGHYYGIGELWVDDATFTSAPCELRSRPAG
jgi:hypothetical protein